MNRSILIESHYLPCIAYFTCLESGSKVWIDIGETYVKQSYRNRCYIFGANQIQLLSVPVHRGSGKVSTRDVRIAHEVRWQNNHWRSIASAYGKTPFFSHFADEFRAVLYKPFRYLVDLNLALLTKCLDLLMWNVSVDFWPATGSFPAQNEMYDYRKKILVSNLTIEDFQFQPIKYIQAFGKDFVPNLSIVDVLFCEGPQASQIIERSITQR
ncbi:MAG: WbqC family protein [Bacteroidota bacterium]